MCLAYTKAPDLKMLLVGIHAGSGSGQRDTQQGSKELHRAQCLTRRRVLRGELDPVWKLKKLSDISILGGPPTSTVDVANTGMSSVAVALPSPPDVD